MCMTATWCDGRGMHSGPLSGSSRQRTPSVCSAALPLHADGWLGWMFLLSLARGPAGPWLCGPLAAGHVTWLHHGVALPCPVQAPCSRTRTALHSSARFTGQPELRPACSQGRSTVLGLFHKATTGASISASSSPSMLSRRHAHMLYSTHAHGRGSFSHQPLPVVFPCRFLLVTVQHVLAHGRSASTACMHAWPLWVPVLMHGHLGDFPRRRFLACMHACMVLCVLGGALR